MMSYSMALVVLYDNGQSLNTCPIRILLTQKTNHTEDMSTQALHAKMNKKIERRPLTIRRSRETSSRLLLFQV